MRYSGLNLQTTVEHSSSLTAVSNFRFYVITVETNHLYFLYDFAQMFQSVARSSLWIRLQFCLGDIGSTTVLYIFNLCEYTVR